MSTGKENLRQEVSQALKNNIVLTREHMKFICRTEGLSDSGYNDLVGEMRTGKFEELTHVPVSEKVSYRTSFFFRSDVDSSEINLSQAEETWLIDKVRNDRKRRRSRKPANVVYINSGRKS